MGDILKAPSSKVSSIETSFSTYESNLKNALSYGEAITNIISDQYLLYGWTKILDKMDKIINKKDKNKEWGSNYIDNLKTLESKLPETPGFSLSYSAISSDTTARIASKPNLSTYKKDNRDGEIVDPDSEASTSESSSSSTSDGSSYSGGGSSSYNGGGSTSKTSDDSSSSGGSSRFVSNSNGSSRFVSNSLSSNGGVRIATTVRKHSGSRVAITSKPTTSAPKPTTSYWDQFNRATIPVYSNAGYSASVTTVRTSKPTTSYWDQFNRAAVPVYSNSR